MSPKRTDRSKKSETKSKLPASSRARTNKGTKNHGPVKNTTFNEFQNHHSSVMYSSADYFQTSSKKFRKVRRPYGKFGATKGYLPDVSRDKKSSRLIAGYSITKELKKQPIRKRRRVRKRGIKKNNLVM